MKLYVILIKYGLLMLLLVGGMVLSYVPNSSAATAAKPTLAVDAFGAHLVLQPTREASPTELAQIQVILTTRLTQAKLNGAFEVNVVAQHIEVNLTEGQDAPVAGPLMSQVGQIQFVDGGIDPPLDMRANSSYPILFSSNQVTDFTLPKSGDIFYRLGLNNAATTHMATFNATQPRQTICMVMDGKVLNCSSMYYWSKNTLEIIPNLSGDGDVTMSNLALFIKSGALPLPLRLED